ncbi:MAG: AraC family transcriptional regulator [Bacteroidota bacterium]
MKPILRKINIAETSSFSIREDKLPFLYNHWHYHPEIELTLVLKSTGTRLVGDSMESFKSGDLVLLGANLPHMWRNDPHYFTKDKQHRAEAIAIHFNENFCGNSFFQVPEMKSIRQLLEDAKRGLKLRGYAKKIVTEKIKSIVKVTGAQRIIDLLDILRIIAESREYTFLSSVGFINTSDFRDSERIDKIFTYSFSNFHKLITIEDVAKVANVSPYYFCKYFKARTSKRYVEFLNEVRIGHACKLLIENKLSITQICFESGFNNLSNFNRHFKSLLKKTPREYIKEFNKTYVHEL